MTKPYEDPALLVGLFIYDAEAGRLRHAEDKRAGHGRIVARAGDYADTSRNSDGYRQVCVTVGGRSYMTKAHRVAWILAHGSIPAGLQIDHINGNRDDNRLCNLRLVTRQENNHNQRKAKGYSWDSRDRRYRAQIHVGDHQIRLGNYDTELDARAAYLRAKRIYHPTAPVELYQ